MAPTLTAEQIEVVREFFASGVADLFFRAGEQALIGDWVTGQTTDAREEAWRQLQVLLQLKLTLRNAAATKKLTDRAQEQRRVSQPGL